MKKLLLLLMVVGLVMAASGTASVLAQTTYELYAKIKSDYSASDFHLRYIDLDGDGKFSLDELISFSGVIWTSGTYTEILGVPSDTIDSPLTDGPYWDEIHHDWWYFNNPEGGGIYARPNAWTYSQVPVSQGEIIATEYQATSESDEQTTPTLGHDAIGDYVVFTSYTPVGSGLAQSDIYYQRLVNGQPVGNRVPVAVTTADERLNECSGDYIVYTRFDIVTSPSGKIMLYQISTGQTFELDSAADSFLPKIYGDVVVWLKVTSTGYLALMYRISWGTPVVPLVLAGPVPSAREIEVGDRFVVWSQIVNGQYDVAAYDIQNGGNSFSVASNPNLHERFPSTGGPWVAYQVSATGTPSVIAIHARNLVTGETRIIVDNGAANSSPNIDGNLITYESNVSGNWDIYVYRIAEGDTFQVTSQPNDQRLNDLHGNLVAYVDARNGNLDVFVSTLTFNINHPPTLTFIGNKTINEGQLLEFGITATDPDGNALTYSASNLPTGAAFDPLNQTFTWTPDYTQAENYNVLFTVTDNGTPPMSASETITITVGNVNRPPILNPIGDKTVDEGQLLQFTITAEDPDGNELIYSASNLPSGAAFDPGSQTFTWIPGYDQYGSYTDVRFIVTDKGSIPLSDQETITIAVGNVNRPPVMGPIGSKTVAEGELLTFTLTATDPDGEVLTFLADDLPNGATFDTSTQEFRWTPGHDQSGNYEVEFSVKDSGSPVEVDSEVVTITVGNVNRAPVFTPVGTQQVFENQLLQFYVMATDYDGDGITYSTSALPNRASFDANSRLFSWRPDSTQAGTYIVTFYATDNGSPQMTGQLDVVINVGDVPTPFQLVDQIIQTVLSLNLPKPIEDSYMTNLKKVSRFVEDGKIIRAIIQLDIFIAKVAIDILQGDIGEAAGRNLINMAINLIKIIKS